MNIAVFGANGGTGRLLVVQAAQAGHSVTALTRHPDDFPVSHPNIRVIAVDVLDPDSVDQSVRGQDAVLSTLGVPYGRKPITLYSEGTANIVTAMQAAGVRRLACVSSSATDPRVRARDSGGGFFFEKVLKPLIGNTMGRTLYADMLRMEQLLRASDLDWTIIRPSGLFHTDAVTDYQVAEDFVRGQYTSRADLAAVLLRQATDQTFARKALAVATFAERPSVVQLIKAEALGISA
jgi:putative NADH-flavin reductase